MTKSCVKYYKNGKTGFHGEPYTHVARGNHRDMREEYIKACTFAVMHPQECSFDRIELWKRNKSRNPQRLVSVTEIKH